MSKITVVITTYNLEQYISACLKELEKQTFQDFDILIVDDCSADHTLELIRAFAEESIRPIRIISTGKNQGLPGRTRNFAMDSGLIQGAYVVFLDGDDSIEPDFLEKLYFTAKKTEADVTICAYDRFEDETGHILCHEMSGFSETVMLPTEQDTIAFLNSSLWNKLIRTEIIGSLRVPDFRVGEDLCFCLGLYENSRKLAFISEELIHYRVHKGSIISNTEEETIYQFAEQLHKLWLDASNLSMKKTLELISFIHIGLSMSMRAYDNPDIDTKKMIAWITDYLRQQYGFFKDNTYLKFTVLSKHGMKGIGLCAALWCYRQGCYLLFLRTFKTVTRILHMDIKF